MDHATLKPAGLLAKNDLDSSKKYLKPLKSARGIAKNGRRPPHDTTKLAPGRPSVEDDVPSHALAASPRPLARTTRNKNEDETKPISRFTGVLKYSLP